MSKGVSGVDSEGRRVLVCDNGTGVIFALYFLG